MFNHNNTYLSFSFGGKNPNYNFTGSYDVCNICCATTDVKPGRGSESKRSKACQVVLMFGKDAIGEYDSWKKICKEHLSEFVCKKQQCNVCNPKAKFDINPRICMACALMLLDGYDKISD